jgi:hypothetical protein
MRYPSSTIVRRLLGRSPEPEIGADKATCCPEHLVGTGAGGDANPKKK